MLLVVFSDAKAEHEAKAGHEVLLKSEISHTESIV